MTKATHQQKRSMSLELPYPPSANHYWRHVGARTLISRGGRAFRLEVSAILRTRQVPAMLGALEVAVEMYPPDRRRRDVDNLFKSLLDALAHGGAYQDDSQIDRLSIVRRNVIKGGKVVVHIKEIELDDTA